MRTFLTIAALLALAVMLDSSFNDSTYTTALLQMLSDIAHGARTR